MRGEQSGGFITSEERPASLLFRGHTTINARGDD